MHYYIHLYFACEYGGVETESEPPLLAHRADEGYAKEHRLRIITPPNSAAAFVSSLSIRRGNDSQVLPSVV